MLNLVLEQLAGEGKKEWEKGNKVSKVAGCTSSTSCEQNGKMLKLIAIHLNGSRLKSRGGGGEGEGDKCHAKCL